MEFVKVECRSCKGTLEIDIKKGSARCPYCNSLYIYDAKKNSDNSGPTDYNSEQYLLENGSKKIELCQYDDAVDTFVKMTKVHPGNWKSWLGQELAYSCRDDIDHMDIDHNVKKCFPDNVLEKIGNGDIFLPSKIKQFFESKIDEEYKNIENSKLSLEYLEPQLKKLYFQFILGHLLLLISTIVIIATKSAENSTVIIAILVFLLSWRILLWENFGLGHFYPCIIELLATNKEKNGHYKDIDAYNAKIKGLENERDYELTNPNGIHTVEYYLNLLQS